LPPAPAPYKLIIAAGRAALPGKNAAAELGPTLSAVIVRAKALLPRDLAVLCEEILPKILDLPVEPVSVGASSVARRSEGSRSLDVRLPAWLPSRRTLGGFYVQRQLG